MRDTRNETRERIKGRNREPFAIVPLAVLSRQASLIGSITMFAARNGKLTRKLLD